MITEFELIDAHGKVIGEGEIDNNRYRVFFEGNDYTEFDSLEAMFAACGGVAIQPKMFPSKARTRQYRMLDD